MQLPLTLSFGPSASLQWCLIGGHVLLGMPVLFLLAPEITAVALLVLLGSLCWQWRALRRVRGSLCLREDGAVKLTCEGRAPQRYALGPHSRVWPGLVVLDLQGGPRLLLLPDAFAVPDAHRRLRVWMRWGAAEAKPTPPVAAE